ncbi:spermatogenesis-associated protein 31A6-like [Loxodonta africana]|uniref:spermatogenesis-associated protein 31A6-like n=1 Tax=Loxodonta africana TaxID=9785 RepID=UPI0030D2BF54
MESYLFPLKSFSVTWMSSSSTSWVLETIVGFLCGVGLFLLLLPCLQSSPPLPPPEKNINIKKVCQALLALRLLAAAWSSVSCSRLGKPPDKDSIRQQSHQDPSCGVGKKEPAEDHRPCAEPPEGAVPLESVVSSSASAAPPTQPPRPLTSALSPDLMIPSVSDLSPSLSVSPPPEPPLPLDSLSPPPLALPPSLPHSPDSFAGLQPPTTFSASPLPDATLTLSQCDSMAMALPLSPFLGSPFPDNCWLTSSVPAITGLDASSRPISTLSWWQVAAKALGLPTSKPCESQQGHTSCQSQESAFWGGHTDRSIGTGNPTFLNPNVQKLLEIQVTKSVEFKIWEEKEQDGSFPNQMSSDYHLNSLRNMMLKSLGDELDTTVSQPIWSTNGKPQQLLSCRKTLQDHLPQKCSQLFWGLPFLHSESLVATVMASGSTLELPSVLFNGLSNALPIQMQAKVSPLVSQPQSLRHPVAHLQPLILTMSQSEAPSLAQVQTQARQQSSLPGLPSSLPQFRANGVSCPRVQNEAKCLISTEIQHLEWPLLQEQLESGRALPHVAERSQEAFSPLSPNLSQDSQASQAHKSDSTLPEDFVSPELRKQLEQHLQKRLIHHQWGLPGRIQQFLKLTQPQEKFPRPCQAEDQKGPSWPSVHGSCKDVKTMGSRRSGSSRVCSLANFHLGRNLSKDSGHSLGKVPKYNISQRSENFPVKVLGADSKNESKNDLMRHSGSNSGNCILRGPHKTQVENTLKVHLGRKWGQIIEDQIPVGVHHSWLAANRTLAKSDTYTKTGSLVSPKGQAYCVNATQNLSFLNPGTQQVLETHIVKFRMGHRWCLLLKVLKAINLFKTRKGNSLPFLQAAFTSSATHESWPDSKAEAARFLGENFQAVWGEKVTPKKSVPTLESPLPASSPVGEEVQRTLRWTPPDNDNGPSEAPQSGQKGRQPFQPLTSSVVGRALQIGTILGAQRGSLELTPSQSMAWKGLKEKSVRGVSGGPSPSIAMLEMSYESQSSGAEDTRHALVAKGSSALQLQDRDILRSSTLAKSQNINVDLKDLGASGTSKSPLPSGMSVQDPGEPCFKSQVISEFEFKMEAQPEDQPQGCPSEMPLQDYAAEVLLAADNLVCQISQSHPRSVSSGDMAASQVLHDLTAARRSSLGQQESKIPNLQDQWKSQSKTSAPTDKKKDCRRPKPEDCEEELAGLGASQANGVSQLSQVKGKGDITESKYLQLVPEKGQAPLEGHFRKRMKCFLQRICPRKKDKGQDDPLQKGNPVSASPQSHRAVKSRLAFTDRGATEAQALMTAVGQILEEKMALQLGLHPSKLSQQKEEIKESQALVGGHSSYHGAPSYPKHRRVMNDTTCHHQATPESQSCPVRERQNRDQHSLKIIRSNNEKLCMRHSASLPPREPMSPKQIEVELAKCHMVPTYLEVTEKVTVCPDQEEVFSDKKGLGDNKDTQFLAS